MTPKIKTTLNQRIVEKLKILIVDWVSWWTEDSEDHSEDYMEAKNYCRSVGWKVFSVVRVEIVSNNWLVLLLN